MPLKTILFVDDEENILRGIKRMLHRVTKEWKLLFAHSGRQALSIFESHPVDVLVTDMKMTDMNGVDLMTVVKKRSPKTIRIVLSGHSARIDVIRSATLAHRYLAKPYNAPQLISAITQCYHNVHILKNKRVKAIITDIDELPALPKTFTQLQELQKSADFSLKKVSAIISEDTGMTANVLKLVNSAHCGLTNRIKDLSQAVSILGADAIQALVLSSHMHSNIRETELIQIEEMQKKSLLAGQFAQIIGELVTTDLVAKHNGYIASLLQNVGTLILVNNLSKQYIAIRAAVNLTVKTTMIQEEYRKLSVSHAEIGAYILGLWGLHDDIVTAVALHHKPQQLDYCNNTVVGIAYLTNIFMEHFDREEDPQFPNLQYDANYCRNVEIFTHIPQCYALCLQAYNKIYSEEIEL